MKGIAIGHQQEIVEIEQRQRSRIQQLGELQKLEKEICNQLHEICEEPEDDSWFGWLFGSEKEKVDIDREKEKFDEILAELRMLSHQLDIMCLLDIQSDIDTLHNLERELQSFAEGKKAFHYVSKLSIDMTLFQDELEQAIRDVQQIHDLGKNVVDAHLDALGLDISMQSSTMNPITTRFLEIHHTEGKLIVERENRLRDHLLFLDEEAEGRYQAMQEVENLLNRRGRLPS